VFLELQLKASKNHDNRSTLVESRNVVPTVLVFKIHARNTKRFWSIGGLVPFTEEQIQWFRQ
jgi:hypothetical protein